MDNLDIEDALQKYGMIIGNQRENINNRNGLRDLKKRLIILE
jgi:hypothetical protein